MNTILITGGSKGIGLGIVNKFLASGYHVISISRDIEPLTKLNNKNLKTFRCDLANEQDRQKLVQELQIYNIAGIISNAAYGSPEPFKSTSMSEIRKHFETNFFAPLELIQEILRNQHIDKFLNISSGAAEFPLQSLLGYCTSKAAIHHAMKCLNLEYPDTKFANLRPGMVDTPLQERWRQFGVETFPSGNFYQKTKEENKLLTVEEVADYVFCVWNQPLECFAKDWNILNGLN